MLLYTVHAKEVLREKGSVAAATGLEKYLGFQPLFCTLLDPDSLADSWFRAYVASPSCAEVIHVYEVADAVAVPMDVVTWCDECLGAEQPDEEALAHALSPSDPVFCDYLLNPSIAPARSWRFDVLDILNGRLSGFALAEQERAQLMHSMASVRAFPHRADVSLGSSLGGTLGALSLKMWYRLMLSASLMPVVWSQVTSHALLPELLGLEPDMLATTPDFREAQASLAAWDLSIKQASPFGHERFSAMRAAFLRGLTQMGAQLVERRAQEAGISRNDACFCGSGRKYKRCCSRKTLDELARVLIK